VGQQADNQQARLAIEEDLAAPVDMDNALTGATPAAALARVTKNSNEHVGCATRRFGHSGAEQVQALRYRGVSLHPTTFPG